MKRQVLILLLLAKDIRSKAKNCIQSITTSHWMAIIETAHQTKKVFYSFILVKWNNKQEGNNVSWIKKTA